MTNAWGGSGTQQVNASGTLVPQQFIANAGQSLFQLSAFSYAIGSNSLLVFINGQLGVNGVDYTETTQSSFTLATPATLNDKITAIGFPLANIIQPSGTFATQTGQTGSFITPAGTTAQRDGSPIAGYTRFNTTLNQIETWFSAALGWLSAVFSTGPTGSLINPSGTTAQRDATPAFGWQRANTTTNQMEWYNGTGWVPMGGGATGGGSDAVFYLNGQVINYNYTVPSGQNAVSTGPLSVVSGKTVTVSTGSSWKVL
jgi:hypothetical protein